MYNVEQIRGDFPILKTTVYGKPLVYLDNAATTQKPQQVIDAMSNAYATINSNVHRGVHHLSNLTTEQHEAGREAVRGYINAKSTNEIIFTRGTTESINLLASSFGEAYLSEGDEVIVSEMEHHANIVSWQLLANRKKIVIKVVPITPIGELDMEAYKALFSPKTKLVSITHVSNLLGTINPVKEIIDIAHDNGVPVHLDGAQGVPHCSVDVQALDADFYSFSSHKMYGPTGMGALYGKEKFLNEMPPYHGGGEMIKHVSFTCTTFNELPYKFEAGTPDYIGVIGTTAAINYINSVGLDNIAEHEHKLLTYTTELLNQIPQVTIYGKSQHKGGVISFNVEGVHPYDIGMLLDKQGVAIRIGHLCAQPLLEALGIESVARASFAMYNTIEECDAFVKALKRAIAVCGL